MKWRSAGLERGWSEQITPIWVKCRVPNLSLLWEKNVMHGPPLPNKVYFPNPSVPEDPQRCIVVVHSIAQAASSIIFYFFSLDQRSMVILPEGLRVFKRFQVVMPGAGCGEPCEDWSQLQRAV